MFENSYRNSIAASLAVFIAFFLIGCLLIAPNEELADPIMNLIMESMGALVLSTDPVVLALEIFLNNLSAALFLFLGGAALGIITGYVLITNGLIIGVVVGYVANFKGIALSAASIVPHGIFELSAFFIASAMGFMLAESVYNEYCGMGDAAKTAKGLGLKFLTIVIPLLFAAALIESFITPIVISMLV